MLVELEFQRPHQIKSWYSAKNPIYSEDSSDSTEPASQEEAFYSDFEECEILARILLSMGKESSLDLQDRERKMDASSSDDELLIKADSKKRKEIPWEEDEEYLVAKRSARLMRTNKVKPSKTGKLKSIRFKRNVNACSEHKRKHQRCPVDCPMRTQENALAQLEDEMLQDYSLHEE